MWVEISGLICRFGQINKADQQSDDQRNGELSREYTRPRCEITEEENIRDHRISDLEDRISDLIPDILRKSSQ